jgi:hypothetical protein
MSKLRKGRIARSRRETGRTRGEIGHRFGIMFTRIRQILDRFRSEQRQAAELVERHVTRAARAALLESPPAQPVASSSRPAVTMMHLVFEALREAFAAHRRYEELRSKGIPHDTAITQALGISRLPP